MVQLHVKCQYITCIVSFECNLNDYVDAVVSRVDCVVGKLQLCAQMCSLFSQDSIDRLEKTEGDEHFVNDFNHRFPVVYSTLTSSVKPVSERMAIEIFAEMERIVTTLENSSDVVSRLESLRSGHWLECPVLWWAGRRLDSIAGGGGRTKLKDFIGANEKTIISVVLSNKDDPPPCRKTQVDGETYNNILSYIHKRNETLRQLERDDDDSYLVAEWTNPKNLKNCLNGQDGGIKWSF